MILLTFIFVKSHHRRILDLAAEDNPNNARVDSYKNSIGYQESLAQGWIEELPKPAGNGFYFRITAAGTEARYRPKLKMLPTRKPLLMAKPRLATFPGRLSSIPKGR